MSSIYSNTAFYGSELLYSDIDYNVAHDAINAESATDRPYTQYVQHTKSGSTYYIARAPILFACPIGGLAGASFSNAYIKLRGNGTAPILTESTHIHIVGGVNIGTAPNVDDWSGLYSDSLGSLALSGWNSTGWNYIHFNSAGENYLRTWTSGWGIFGIRVDNDLVGIPPTGTNQVLWRGPGYATSSVRPGIYLVFDIGATPTVATNSVLGIGATQATGRGNVTDDGGASITAYGVCWNTTGTPTTADDHTDNGAGSEGAFETIMSGLAPGQLYYVRAYATNPTGTGYGNEVTFTTREGYPTGYGTSRINGLVHRYDRKSGLFTLETCIGGVVGNVDDMTDTIYKAVGVSLPSAYEPAKVQVQDGYIS